MKRIVKAAALFVICVFSSIADASHSLVGPAPPGPGAATFCYDPSSGGIVVRVNSVVIWYVEHVSYSLMTGDAPLGLPMAAGLVTDNDTRIGESAFAPFSYDVNLGHVAATDLFAHDGNWRIYWNATLDGELQSAMPGCIPEPSTLVLAGMGICGLLAGRRRRVG